MSLSQTTTCACGQRHSDGHPPYCERCQAHHPPVFSHIGDCTRCKARPALQDRGKPTLWCADCKVVIEAERAMPDIDPEDDDEAFFTSLRGGNALLGKGVSQ